MKPEPPVRPLLVSSTRELGHGQWHVPVSRTRDIFVMLQMVKDIFEILVVAEIRRYV